MKAAISNDKKLTVVYRIEPGCLGPKGDELVKDFCLFAQQKFEPVDAEIVNWIITPRFDKALPELQYRIQDKLLTQDHAARYLSMFDMDIGSFEEHMEETLVESIELFMDR